MLKRLASDHRGATIIEYSVILAVLALVVTGVVRSAGDKLSNVFNDIAADLVIRPHPTGTNVIVQDGKTVTSSSN